MQSNPIVSGLVVRFACAVGCAVTSAGAAPQGAATFTEVSASIGINSVHAPAAALETAGSILAFMTSGGVVADFDNDGDQDLFVVSGGATPDALFINDGTGHFTDMAASWSVAVKHMGMAAAAGDYDGDGWIDLFVASLGPDGQYPSPGKHRLYRNTGTGAFSEVAAQAGVQVSSPITYDGTGAAWGDYDLDGDLDLFITGWKQNAQGNRLYRNNGDGTFTNATASAGLILNGVRGFSPRFVDMNGDRWPELLIAADFGTSRYYINRADGTFSNATVESGTGLDANGMGQTVGDLDGDGALDWYVTSVFGAAGAGVPGTGNTLYRNTGGGGYDELAEESGVVDGNWGWGAAAVDLNHDGLLDLLETNGWFSQPRFQNSPSRVWIQQIDGHFDDVATSCGLWHTDYGRGLLTADIDNDGDRDVMIFSNKGPLRVYRNDLAHGEGTGWITITLDTSDDASLAPNGVGSRVTVTSVNRQWVKVIDAGTNFQSQDDGRVHAGVGWSEIVDVRVDWNDGTATFLRSVPRNQFLTIASGVRCDLDHDQLVGAPDLALLLESWGPIDKTDERDLDADGEVGPRDVGFLLAAWTVN